MSEVPKQDAPLIRETFDVYAKEYEDKFNQNALGIYQRQRVQREIAPFLKPGMTILDVGCGPGSDFEFYHQQKLQVEAIDISAGMIKLAEQRAKQLELDAKLHVSNLSGFTAEQTFPLIILNFGVVNALTDFEGDMHRLSELLSPDGHLFIISMPPFHAFSAIGDLARLRLRSAARRIIRKEATTAGGMTFRYYRSPDFTSYFKMLNSVNLATLLPTPDQYANSAVARGIYNLLRPLDRALASNLPDLLGGDHVLYHLTQKTAD